MDITRNDLNTIYILPQYRAVIYRMQMYSFISNKYFLLPI